MTKLNYNLEAKLKKLKKMSQTYFLTGYSSRVVSNILGLSETLVTEWHDEFVKDVLKNSPSKRIFLREMLLKNSPQMILILTQLANQKGDEKLSYSAASAVLSFASKFMNEDIKILAAEDKIKDEVGEDGMLSRGLFDFRDPDVEAAELNNPKKKTPLSIIEQNHEAEISRAFDEMQAREAEKKRLEENTPADEYAEVYERKESSGDGQSADVGLFDGFDDDAVTDLL